MWIPPEREAELRSLAERWRVEADKVLGSDLPNGNQLRALVQSAKASGRPVPAQALASRAAAAARLGEVARAGGADQ